MSSTAPSKKQLSLALTMVIYLSLTAGLARSSRAETFFQCGRVIQNYPCGAGEPYRIFALPGSGRLFSLANAEQEPRARLAPGALDALLEELMEEGPPGGSESDSPARAEAAKTVERQARDHNNMGANLTQRTQLLEEGLNPVCTIPQAARGDVPFSRCTEALGNISAARQKAPRAHASEKAIHGNESD